MHWISLQNIHAFTYLKALLHTLLWLLFKIVESLECILNARNKEFAEAVRAFPFLYDKSKK